MTIKIRPTKLDTEIAHAVAAHAEPLPELLARTLTYGADEKVLLVFAGMAWVYAHAKKRSLRPAADHVFTVTLVTAILPHILKRYVNQTRPDRCVGSAHRRGIPISGRANDAFPSGHAVHMGALASAATALRPKYRNMVWGATIGLAVSRIVILAHWTSDVIIGFGIGAVTERVVRRFTRFPLSLETRRRRQ
ncbi:membrane-associated phospholipid phosphatase [Nitrobacteraceae bacterium AZCC 1564]